MALKPDRDVLQWDVSKFYSSSAAVASRGGIVSATGTVPSGAAMDQSVSQVWYHTNVAVTGGPSGAYPVGMLMGDVVNVDLTRQILNPNKSEAQLGDKVTLMQKGWVVTNLIDTTTGPTVGVGVAAYLSHSGYIGTEPGGLQNNAGETPDTTANARVGKFLTAVDEDGYAKVYIDL